MKIFRGPTHSIPHLLQFAPKPKSFTPLASDIREYLQKMNSDEVKILHESEEGQTECTNEDKLRNTRKNFLKIEGKR